MTLSEPSRRLLGAMLVLIATLLAEPAASLAQSSSTPAGAAPRRVALVIGNSTYHNLPRLTNPSNDARLVADTLASLGFILVGGGAQLDLDKPSFVQGAQRLGQELQTADVGLFYYAGHGLQVQGT